MGDFTTKSPPGISYNLFDIREYNAYNSHYYFEFNLQGENNQMSECSKCNSEIIEIRFNIFKCSNPDCDVFYSISKDLRCDKCNSLYHHTKAHYWECSNPKCKNSFTFDPSQPIRRKRRKRR